MSPVGKGGGGISSPCGGAGGRGTPPIIGGGGRSGFCSSSDISGATVMPLNWGLPLTYAANGP